MRIGSLKIKAEKLSSFQVGFPDLNFQELVCVFNYVDKLCITLFKLWIKCV